MPLQGVYGEYTPRSGAPQHSGSHSPCAGQCVTFRPARDHCDAAARLPRVRRHPPASRDHPARLEHGLPAHLPRESSRDLTVSGVREGKKTLPRRNGRSEGGHLGGEGALDLPPPDRRRGGPRKNRGDSSKNELVVLDLPQHGRATRELRGKVSHSRGPSARVKQFLSTGVCV